MAGTTEILDMPLFAVREKISEVSFDGRVRSWISRAIRETGLSRKEVARRLSAMLGVRITESMINAWCAESKGHRFPAAYIPALAIITEDDSLIKEMAEFCGIYVVTRNQFVMLKLAEVREEKRRLGEIERELLKVLRREK